MIRAELWVNNEMVQVVPAESIGVQLPCKFGSEGYGFCVGENGN